MTRVVTLGEGLGLIRGDGIGSLDQLSSTSIGTGGAEANVAIALRRLGIDVDWLGRLGDDSLGRRVARELRAEGVGVKAFVDGSAPTGLMLKESPSAGRTRVTFYRAGSAGSRISPSDLELLDIPSARLLHITGILPALSQSALDTTLRAIEIARTAGVEISFDVNHRASLWDATSASLVYRAIAAHASIVFGGVEELELLDPSGRVSSDDRRLASIIADLGPSEIVIKRGEDGAATLVDGDWFDVPARRAQVVDTVGAGDAFVAAYLARRLRGGSTIESLTDGARNGAAACEHPGDWEGSLRLAELDAPEQRDAVAR